MSTTLLETSGFSQELLDKHHVKSAKLFLPGLPEKNQKLFDVSKMIGFDPEKLSVEKNGKKEYLNVQYIDSEDTEFYTSDVEWLSQQSRTGLSTQIKGIHPDAPKKIFWHKKHAAELNQARVKAGLKALPVVGSDAHFVDYLKDCGCPVSIDKVKEGEDLSKLPIFTYTMNAHFATAELLMVFDGRVKTEVKKFIREKKIIARRRLVIENFIHPGKSEDWVQFETVVIVIGGVRYALRLRIIDTCAIHGVAQYKDIAQNVGWELKHKDKLSKKDKGKMLDVALTRPADFEAYALGDLDVWDILAMYDVKWREVYKILGLEKYYREPALTIGASVRDLFCAALASKLNIGTTDEKGNFEWKKDFDKRLKVWMEFNATEIRSWVESTAVLLCKVEGGRCRNNRPKSTFIKRKTTNGYDVTYDKNIIIDIDISGCYGEGQRNQLFFLGHPAVMELDLKGNKERYNKYPTLREVLKSLDVKIDVLKRRDQADWENTDNWGQLVSGGWMMRVSTSESLKYGQDFFASWFTLTGHKTNIMSKFIKGNLSTDTELIDNLEGIDFDEKYGTTKIFEHELHNGILTHEGLQWILATASDRQRNELLDKITVLAGAYYPRAREVKPTSWETAIDELDSVYENWQGKNTLKVTNAKTGATQQNYESCHAWIGINLGELIVDKLLIERKRAIIKFGKKSPLDQLFKLCVNTLYGDMVSPYFIISNPIVGNNITARARALAWYMEKGFNGFESITDGCGFLLNEVIFNIYQNRKEVNGELIGDVRDKRLKDRKITDKPLGGYVEILAYWKEFLRFDKDKPEGVTDRVLGLILIDKKENQEDLSPTIEEDKDHPGFFVGKPEKAMKWLDGKISKDEKEREPGAAMEHLQSLFPCVDVLHAKTTYLDVDKHTLQPIYTPRTGQFSFETKDAYVAGGFHGSANYIFQKPDGLYLIKMRGYETGKNHESVKWEHDLEPWQLGLDSNENEEKEQFIKTGRYGKENNPGKDFMIQLLNNPEAIKRQEVAIKEGIFKVGEYVENADKFDRLGIEPGDTIKRKMLMQEFSLTQFTFKTYEQYISWKNVIEKDKTTERQSLEGFFLNGDGTLNFIKMTEWVADAIERGVTNPYKELDEHNNKARDRQCSHPQLENYEMIGKKLDGLEVKENSESQTETKQKATPKTGIRQKSKPEEKSKFVEKSKIKNE
ncbi:MAG: hypothetical protein KME46_33965 [Brasilonema angustatum HA4187-MV1]|jgi:hypothetical protein|nr:hypothetical protein [Brasilonema angustatum HA4187-MV1]